jgi:hypothetical protein
MKIHEFDPVIYPCKLWVTKELTDELDDIFEMFPEDGETNIPIELAGAMTFSVKNRETNDLGFLVAFKSAKRMTVNIIAHEARHVGDMLFERIGEDPQHSEPAAYFTGWVAECIDKVKRGKAGDLNKK